MNIYIYILILHKNYFPPISSFWTAIIFAGLSLGVLNLAIVIPQVIYYPIMHQHKTYPLYTKSVCLVDFCLNCDVSHNLARDKNLMKWDAIKWAWHKVSPQLIPVENVGLISVHFGIFPFAADGGFCRKWALGRSLRRWKPTGIRSRSGGRRHQRGSGPHNASVAASRSGGHQGFDCRRISLGINVSSYYIQAWNFTTVVWSLWGLVSFAS